MIFLLISSHFKKTIRMKKQFKWIFYNNITQKRKIKILFLILFFLFIAIRITNFYNATDLSLKSTLNFGFSPEYLNIAKNTFEQGYFSTKFPNGQVYNEMQREPLYPILLIMSGYIIKNFEILTILQVILLLTTISIWTIFIYKKFGAPSAIFLYTLLILNPIPFFYSLIFYPYIINIFFATLGVLLLSIGIEKNKYSFLCLAGVFFAFSSYERGIYLVFPLAMSLVLLIFSHLNLLKEKIEMKKMAYFLLPFLLIISPWIIRNSYNGVFGMNGMNGYSLGYTYGSLNSPLLIKSDEITYYDELVKSYGTDDGTSKFINQEITNNKLPFSEADKKTTSIIIDKIKNNPRETIKIIVNNLIAYPSRLTPNTFLFQDYNSKLFDFYNEYTARNIPSFFDYLIIIIAMIGIIYKMKCGDIFAIISFSILIYLFLINTILTIFDPRYRGISDFIIFSFVFVGFKFVYRLIIVKKYHN